MRKKLICGSGLGWCCLMLLCGCPSTLRIEVLKKYPPRPEGHKIDFRRPQRIGKYTVSGYGIPYRTSWPAPPGVWMVPYRKPLGLGTARLCTYVRVARLRYLLGNTRVASAQPVVQKILHEMGEAARRLGADTVIELQARVRNIARCECRVPVTSTIGESGNLSQETRWRIYRARHLSHCKKICRMHPSRYTRRRFVEVISGTAIRCIKGRSP